MCMQCKSANVAEIIYGLCDVDDELEHAINKKEIILGGCLIGSDDPKWCCNDCGKKWGGGC